MSTLEVSNISDKTTSVPTGYVVNGSAKAWCRFSMVTPAIEGSLNISSITDSATGHFDINLSTDMGDVNYVATFASNQLHTNNSATPTTSTFRMGAYGSSNSGTDASRSHAAAHGSLA
jgi:hypothetical protein